MNAKDVLYAIRLYKNKSAVLREVSVTDPLLSAIYNRWKLEGPHGRYYEKKFEENPDKWPLADSVPEGWSPRGPWERRIDALIIDRERTAVEIKVTRSDFNSETEEKRAPWRHYTHKFVYAVPTGLVKPDEVPDYCGLWYIDPDRVAMGKTRYQWLHGVSVVKKARKNDAADLPASLVKSLMGRLSRYEFKDER